MNAMNETIEIEQPQHFVGNFSVKFCESNIVLFYRKKIIAHHNNIPECLSIVFHQLNIKFCLLFTQQFTAFCIKIYRILMNTPPQFYYTITHDTEHYTHFAV